MFKNMLLTALFLPYMSINHRLNNSSRTKHQVTRTTLILYITYKFFNKFEDKS